MTNPARRQQSIRFTLRGVALLALLALALLVSAGPAAAAKSCGKKVVDDWYADGRVDGTYPPHCYDDAIEILPRDVRDYSSAKDDISRALQNRLNGLPAPPATAIPNAAASRRMDERTNGVWRIFIKYIIGVVSIQRKTYHPRIAIARRLRR